MKELKHISLYHEGLNVMVTFHFEGFGCSHTFRRGTSAESVIYELDILKKRIEDFCKVNSTE